MGDAKRRKQSDPMFGISKPPSLKIDISPQTGNFIIACSYCGYWLDSASKRADAEKVLNAVLDILKDYPLKHFVPESWKQWMSLHQEKSPMVDALMFTVQGKDKKKFLEDAKSTNFTQLDSSLLKTIMFSEIIDIEAES